MYSICKKVLRMTTLKQKIELFKSQGMTDAVARQQAETLHAIQKYEKLKASNRERAKAYYWRKLEADLKEKGMTWDDYNAQKAENKKRSGRKKRPFIYVKQFLTTPEPQAISVE